MVVSNGTMSSNASSWDNEQQGAASNQKEGSSTNITGGEVRHAPYVQLHA